MLELRFKHKPISETKLRTVISTFACQMRLNLSDVQKKRVFDEYASRNLVQLEQGELIE